MNRVKNIIAKALCAGVFSLSMFLLVSVSAYADGKATVTANSAYLRANASTSGTVVGGAMKNDTLEILSTESDSSGYTWYKVKANDGTTGYIRADLVSTDGGASQTTTTTTETPTPSVTLEQTIPTEVVPVAGSITSEVRVRSGASTSHTIVTTAKANTAVTVLGYAVASDGSKWYQISYAEVSGYIRSDFIKLDGELVDKVDEPEPEPEPEPMPEPEPEPEVYKDYEAVFNPADETWYLNNYIEGTKSSIPELLKAKDDLAANKLEAEKALKKKNVAIIILTVVILALIGVGVYAYISVRRWYYGVDEETEEPASAKTAAPVKRTQPVTETKVRTESQPIRVQTVGGVSAAQPASRPAIKQSALTGEKLPDGSIRMADGSIKRPRVGVRMPDGSIKLEDGTIIKPKGTAVKPEPKTEEAPVKPYIGASSQEIRRVPYSRTSEANSDDDMEYGFLDLDDGIDN